MMAEVQKRWVKIHDPAVRKTGLAFDAAQRVYGTSAVYAYAYTYVNDLHDTCTCWRQPN